VDAVRPGREGSTFPAEVGHILGLPPDRSLEVGWDAFLTDFGELLLRACRYGFRDDDAAMDAYAFALGKLREDDLRRLRGFPGGDRDTLSRWLVVVARRLVTDFRRHRYGRVRPATAAADLDARRRLIDGIWDPRDSQELPDSRTSDPEWTLRLRERREAVDAAMRRLEPRDRLLLAFRFDEELPARRIAELMDFPTPFHVYRRLNRILADLRAQLLESGIEGPSP
jgi:RNA polymerase sigma factor (sigma-70 family)